MDTPQLRINEVLYRSSTFPSENPSDGLPLIDDNETAPLEELLRKFMIKHPVPPVPGFWSPPLLNCILSRNRILDQLRKYSGNTQIYIDFIRPRADPLPGSATETFLKIFALLLLIERGHEIGNFINEHMSDQSLPVCFYEDRPERRYLCLHSQPGRVLKCFEQWRVCDREMFEAAQWQVLVPYFDLDGKKARHFDFNEKVILPWRTRGARSLTSSQSSQNSGGYASVSCIKIDPHCHGFHDVGMAIGLNNGLFALKVLHDEKHNDAPKFENEKLQLQRFNGLVHDHLVTLLATFTVTFPDGDGLRNRYHFLFPFADYALDQYWEKKEPDPKMQLDTIRWVSKQCSGIIEAIDIIHEPQHLPTLDVKRYGRHGDIKPDNILWFRSSKDPRGILVISDMGLSAFNSDNSRSNIPNSRIPKVPGYRPPECDIRGGTISRAYDIWTLGCLFLELLTWLVGGQKLLNKFEEQRTSMYITGANNNMFFELKEIKDSDGYVAQVKIKVTEWFVKLHGEMHCTQFIHDALDVIEKEMLVVQSLDRKRSSSRVLQRKFNDMDRKCQSDEDYCTKGSPKRRLVRAQTAVVAKLNETAQQAIQEAHPGLQTHEGKTANPIGAEELKKM